MSPPSHRSRLVRLARAAFATVIILAIAAVALWWLTYQPPTWYAPPDPEDEAVARLADTAEYRIVEEAQRIRPEEESWTLVIRDDQVNAWLAARLPRWLANDARVAWPDALGMPQVHATADGVELALPLRAVGDARAFDAERVITARVVPDLDGTGRLGLRVDRFRIGRLALPGEPVLRLLEFARQHAGADLDRPDVRRVLDVIEAGERLDPIIRLADGRDIRIDAIRLDAGAARVTCTTLLPDGGPAVRTREGD